MIFALPDELVQDICRDWLYIEELGKVDIATCSWHWRRFLLNSLQGLILKGGTDYPVVFYEWIRLRNLFVAEFRVNHALSRPEAQSTLQYLCQKVEVLRIDPDMPEEFSLVYECPNLTFLYCAMCDFNWRTNRDILRQLRCLEFLVALNNEWSVISENCRELRILKQTYRLFQCKEQLCPLDVLRLNVHLHTIELSADDTWISQLTKNAFPSLTSVSLCGDIDFNALVPMLHIKTIMELRIKSVCNCEYKKCSAFLHLMGSSPVSGLRNFLQEITDLQHIEWEYGGVQDDPLVQLIDRRCNTLHTVNLVMFDPPSDLDYAKYILDNCTVLKTLKYRTLECDWGEVLNENNRLTHLTIRTDDPDIEYILQTCHHLTYLSFGRVNLAMSYAHNLIPMIEQYKNEESEPFHFEVHDAEGEEPWLCYDKNEFSGWLWDEYTAVVDGVKRDSEWDRDVLIAANASLEQNLAAEREKVRELAAENERLKCRLYQYEQ